MSDEEHRREDEAAATSGEGSEVERTAAGARREADASPDAGDPDDAGIAAPGPETEAGEAWLDPEAGESPIPAIEEELGEARREARENLDRALRAHAELENVRRRLERDLQNAHRFALERFVSELLPVRDSLELGLAASSEKGASAASIAEGVELTLRMLDQTMEKFGVKAVDPAGEPFDPEFHQAMTIQESDTAESGTVLTVVQKGCLLNERLVRPAMVIVAK